MQCWILAWVGCKVEFVRKVLLAYMYININHQNVKKMILIVTQSTMVLWYTSHAGYVFPPPPPCLYIAILIWYINVLM